jgi:hypothetical protein
MQDEPDYPSFEAYLTTTHAHWLMVHPKTPENEKSPEMAPGTLFTLLAACATWQH